jgi:Transposase DDE domain
MTSEAITNDEWPTTVERLGGRDRLEKEGRETGAFRRAREIECAVDCLRLVLAYCLGALGLRLTAARAEALGIASISNVALLKRVRKALPWLECLVARQLAAATPGERNIAAAHGRLVRLVDGTTVAKKGLKDQANGGLWRVQATFDLPTERFSAFDLTDETVGEQFDRAAVVAGEIRIGDRYYLQPERIAKVLVGQGDIIVRARWNAVRWLEANGDKADLIAMLKAARGRGIIDRSVWIARADAPPLALRLVAIRRPKEARDQAIEAARRKAKKNGATIQPQTLVAAEWMILVTSLPKETFSLADISALYRLRWRIEIAFKHLKSGTGLTRPPAETAAMAKAYVLAHLLLILLTEPLIAEHLGDSPRREAA